MKKKIWACWDDHLIEVESYYLSVNLYGFSSRNFVKFDYLFCYEGWPWSVIIALSSNTAKMKTALVLKMSISKNTFNLAVKKIPST